MGYGTRCFFLHFSFNYCENSLGLLGWDFQVFVGFGKLHGYFFHDCCLILVGIMMTGMAFSVVITRVNFTVICWICNTRMVMLMHITSWITNKWSYIEILDIVDKLGYKENFNLWWSENVDIRHGVKILVDDSHAMCLANYA